MRISIQFWLLFRLIAVGISVEIPVFEITIFKREVFLLPLAPFLVIEVNVGPLQKNHEEQRERS